jgi:NAD(P)H-hydrate epimerase
MVYYFHMRLANRKQCQEIDRQSQQAPGLGEEKLMENGGLQAALWIEKNFLTKSHIRSVLLLAGPGHNGADGFVVIRHISKFISDIDIMTVSDSDRPLWKAQRERLPGSVHFLPLQPVTKKYDLIIDALFGIGLNKNLEGVYASCLQSLKQQPAPLLSLDAPSGLDVSTGKILGASARATHTLTFAIAKSGFFVNEGPACCGRIHILDIGIPRQIVRALADSDFSVSKKWVRQHRPHFGVAVNKSKRGRSLLLAGSKEYPGAGVLCARAALRAGSGYALLASQNAPVSSLENPDFLVRDLQDSKLSDFHFDAVAIGPGLGTGPSTRHWIEELKKHHVEKVVIDADALTVCMEQDLFPLPPSWVATPHAGELSRILGLAAAEIEGDRFRFAREGQKKIGCQVLLKGYHSVLCTGDKCIVIPTGNPALAKSGTGDVLTGMITAFMAQGLGTTRAALMGCYFHGAAADLWVREGRDPAAFLASDLIETLPRLFRKISALPKNRSK